MIRFIIVLIEILVSYLLQSSVFPYFELAGVVPDILLILVVSTAFFRGQTAGLLTGFAAGLMMDFCTGELIGLFAVFYMVIGFFNGYACKIFDKDDYLLPLGMIAVSEFIYEFFYYVFQVLLRGTLSFSFFAVHVMLPRVLYTAAASILFYKLFQLVHLTLVRFEKKER